MKLLWDELSLLEVDEATAELIQRLRQNPEALLLLNDILGVWLDSGAREDFDHYISNLMLEAENTETPAAGRNMPEVHLEVHLPVMPHFPH